ncbi:MAG: amidohydrolase family protein [bacterium]|nr:amidohydrolase family protein [bacterium]
MRFLALLLTLGFLCGISQAGDLLAIRAKTVYTGSGEVLNHAVILVDDGKIVTIGEDLPIERGIPVLELDDNQVVVPGFVQAYTRLGSTTRGRNGTDPQLIASAGFYPTSTLKQFGEAGIVLAGYYPAGRGMPGQASAMRPLPADGTTFVAKASTYVKLITSSSKSEKDRIRSIYEEIEKFKTKAEKHKSKYDKAKEKADKAAKKEKDKAKKKAILDKVGKFTALKPNSKEQAFIDMESGKLPALVSIGNAGTFLHFKDALGEKALSYSLRMPISLESDFANVKDDVGKAGLRVVMDPTISVNPGTRQQRNLPNEFVKAGARLVLIPRSDSSSGAQNWRKDVVNLIKAGLDEQVALSAMTLEPANLLGMGETHGSLEAGKVADLLILSGKPFEPASEIEAVMVDGTFVHGEAGL